MATIPKIAMIPSGYKAGKVYSVLPTNGDADLTFTRVSEATRVDETGLIETMATGVPRLDYSGGGCPSLLVEPQTTNLHLRSEEFDNVYWAKNGVTITPNNAISPKGDLTMDLMTESAISEPHILSTGASTITPDVFQTFSIFFKKQSGSAQRYLRMDIQDTSFSNAGRALFDIETGTIALAPINVGTATGVTSKIEDYGNGIYRASVTVNLNGGFTQCRTQIILQNQKTTYVAAYLGDGVSGVNLWGAQLESLPYATSYIPTVASAVTRVEETASKTGLSSYINSQEGVLYMQVSALANSNTNRWFSLSDGTTSNIVEFRFSNVNNGFRCKYTIGGAVNGDVNVVLPNSVSYNKIAFRWENNNFAIFVNGTNAGGVVINLTTGNMNLNRLGFDLAGIASTSFHSKVKDLQIFNQALTDQELQTLTTL